MVKTDIADLIDRYVAVWNEADPHVRRKRVGELWAPDGVTYHRFIDARGREAVEARVAGSWVKWVQTNGYVFRSRRNAMAHHDIVTFNWEMVPASGGDVAAVGLEFLLLGEDNFIRRVYQFSEPPPPAIQDVSDLAQRYVAIWNEPDPGTRRSRIAELWAPDGRRLSETSDCTGREAIEDEVRATCDPALDQGFAFSACNVDGHHDVIHMDVEMRDDAGGEPSAITSAFLMLDDGGRVRFDYQFVKRPPREAE